MSPKLSNLFQNAHHIVFLTGAGVSTTSGIPDYRSKNGLYHQQRNKRSAEWYLSHRCLMRHPQAFHHFMVKFMYHPKAQPNVIHRTQARLTRQGKATIITQNVDNLYRKAHVDSQRLIEFHGNIYRCRCLKCHQKVSWRDYIKTPYHQKDGGIIHPNLTLYGESLDPQRYRQSLHVMLNADLIVIVGTSMKVEPFADLIKYHQPHVPIVAINRKPLHFSYNIGLKMIKEDAETFFKGLSQLIN